MQSMAVQLRDYGRLDQWAPLVFCVRGIWGNHEGLERRRPPIDLIEIGLGT
jgi:hypothetical protein